MIVILAALCGAVVGALTARRRDGKGLDMAQYAFGYGVAFGVVALVATTLIRALA
jgi:hypothetical protein